MRNIKLFLSIALLFMAIAGNAQEFTLEEYVSEYDYQARKEMKIQSKQLIGLIKTNKAQLVDIRFEEEYQSWNMPFAISIPLPNLPQNLDKLDRDKIIVTACPHKDRAIIAMTYLKTRGYEVKYLMDGLLGLANNLRGDNALRFINE